MKNLNSMSDRDARLEQEAPIAAQQQFQPADVQTRQRQLDIQQAEEGHVCGQCKHPVSPTDDICENCGEWLLVGQCCFCYAPAEPNQKFCAECGNPPTGIVCHSCGTHSFFDYCPNCHESLTEQAAETLAFIQQSPEFQEVLQLHSHVQQLIEKGGSQAQIDTGLQQIEQRLNDWNAFNERVQQQRQQQRSTRRNPAGGSALSFDLNAAQINSQQLAAEQQYIAQQAAAAREQLLQTETDQMNRIAAMQQKLFADHQSTRRYHESLKLLIPSLVPKTKKVKRITGWLCVWANYLHPEGPCDCGNPSLGGSWQYEIDEIQDGFDISFNTK